MRSTSLVSPLFLALPTKVIGVSAAPLTLEIASSMVFLPVPPMLLVVITPVFASIVVVPPIKFFTLLAVLYNWLPLIASVELAVTDPAATLLSLVAVVVEPFAF